MADTDYLAASDGTGDAALMHVSSPRTAGATIIQVDTVAGVPAFFIGTWGTLLATGFIDPATKRDFFGHVNAGTLVIDKMAPGNTDGGNTTGQVVVIKPSTPTQNLVGNFVKTALNNFGEGQLLNGKIVPTISTNNLVVSLKTLNGVDPSTTDVVYVRIGGTVRSVTAPLSVTLAAGTNWFSKGSPPFATTATDLFVYMGYNATDGVVIGVSGTMNSNYYNDFSTTNTDKNYAKISTITTAAATDKYNVVNRFNAILGVTATFLWTLPAGAAATVTNQVVGTPTVLAGQGMWWQELGRATAAAGANPTSLSVLFTAKKYLQIIFVQHSGGASLQSVMRFNNDSGANYDQRTQENATADAVLNGQNGIILGTNTLEGAHGNFLVTNETAFNKVADGFITFWTTGAGQIYRNQQANKWNNSAAQISRVDMVALAGSYKDGSELIVLGHD